MVRDFDGLARATSKLRLILLTPIGAESNERSEYAPIRERIQVSRYHRPRRSCSHVWVDLWSFHPERQSPRQFGHEAVASKPGPNRAPSGSSTTSFGVTQRGWRSGRRMAILLFLHRPRCTWASFKTRQFIRPGLDANGNICQRWGALGPIRPVTLFGSAWATRDEYKDWTGKATGTREDNS